MLASTSIPSSRICVVFNKYIGRIGIQYDHSRSVFGMVRELHLPFYMCSNILILLPALEWLC